MIKVCVCDLFLKKLLLTEVVDAVFLGWLLFCSSSFWHQMFPNVTKLFEPNMITGGTSKGSYSLHKQ